jgi:FKBP-type peptidyl-prolyl cis-trans isomerase FkpA
MIGSSRSRCAIRPLRGSLPGLPVAFATALALLAGGAETRAEDLSDDEKIFYYMGIVMEKRLRSFALSDEELDLLIRGLREAHAGEPLELDRETYHPKFQKLGVERMEEAAAAEKREAHAFLAEAAQRPGAIRSETGMVYTELTPGSGESPQATNTVSVHYRGTLRDGSVFVDTVQRGKPFEFRLDRAAIPCWGEGLSRMKVGGKSLIICPPELAYGERGVPPTIPGNAVLSFEVELLEIK